MIKTSSARETEFSIFNFQFSMPAALAPLHRKPPKNPSRKSRPAASPTPPRELPRSSHPDAFALALEGGRVRGISQHFLELSARQLGPVRRQIKFGQLHPGAWIRMVVRDALPD